MPAATEAPAHPPARGLGRWLKDTRSSSRLAFLLQLVSRVLMSLAALVWTRLLLRTMGTALNGVFLAFQGVAQLGGLGDLGMGGAVALQAGRYLGEGRQQELQSFLAVARTVFLLLALSVGGSFLLLSPWLGHWLGFPEVPGAGSFPLLFAVGALSVGMLVLASYVTNLNYACCTLTWPVIPAFGILQCGLLAHWWLARKACPLWVQYLPYTGAYLIGLALAWIYLKTAFPSLATVLPLKLDFRTAGALFEKSFWLYLCSLGNLVYIAADRLVIQAWFGADKVPVYHNNYKICELATFMICTASFVSLPKITLWLADSSPQSQDRVITEIRRMNQFEAAAGCAAALGYLAINNFFMVHWLGTDMKAPLFWQTAFALNLAITTGGDAGIQVATRCGERGVRAAGGLIGVTALVNVALSILAAKLGYIVGIALATCVAQSLLSLGLGLYVCRHLKLPRLTWALRSWLMPVITVGIGAAARWFIHLDSVVHASILIGGYALLIVAMAWVQGVRPALIREEWNLVKSFVRPG